ncbi:MAG: WbqC family protein [Candidatus Omnitrophica bacterium]|nr:WbqC family protein [Candidatus Omnitrophota bacterium]
MILSVHQPQYIPWLGYFDKIRKSDCFVFLDDVQYKKREYENRNKIKASDGAHWLTVPVITKGAYFQKINDVLIDDTQRWQEKHYKAIEFSYHKAPDFKRYLPFLEEVFIRRKWEKLVDLNIFIIKFVLKELEIGTTISLESEIAAGGQSTDRIINICRKLGCDSYLSGMGGSAYLVEEKFSSAGIKLIYQDFKHPEYPQQFGGFESNLSVIDLLLNCGPHAGKYFS